MTKSMNMFAAIFDGNYVFTLNEKKNEIRKIMLQKFY